MIKQEQLASLLKKEMEKGNQTGIVSQKDLETFLEQYTGNDRIVRSDELVKEIEKNGIRKGMSTGEEDLDKIIGGFYEEQVIILTAYPKSGKSSWVLYTIDQMNQYQPLFLALEQSARELIEQSIENGMKVPMFYTPSQIDEVDRNTDWIHLKILESQYRAEKDGKEKTKVVFIDHFGYIIPKQRSSDQATWEIIRTMQELKSIAKQTKTAIVVIVHTTKPDETEPPTVKDLFGSAGYHQEADTVLSLWREAYKNDDKVVVKTKNVLLQVVANRKKGENGAIKFRFDNGKFIREEWSKTTSSADAKTKKELDDFVGEAVRRY